MVLHVLLFTCENNILSSICCGGVQLEFVFSVHSKQQREFIFCHFSWGEGHFLSLFMGTGCGSTVGLWIHAVDSVDPQKYVT